MTTRSKKRELSEQFQSLSTADTKNCDSRDESSGAESEAECPGCGLVYREDNLVWIQCDGCGLWWDTKCTEVDDDKNILLFLFVQIAARGCMKIMQQVLFQ